MAHFHSLVMALAIAALVSRGVGGQIRVHPTGVNVNAQGATTVFLSYGGLAGYDAVEGVWCGELIPATPSIGRRCDPTTIFGSLPLRYDWRQLASTGGLTDLMTIPPSVARRAYQAAEAGAPSAFYYVRRFRHSGGQPDQYVAVTCRLSGGGARTPLSLTNVELSFATRGAVLHVTQGEPLAPFEARIGYTGSGHLVGRWEVVLPGDELPTVEDLQTEASLPLEMRGTQRRYTSLGRVNVYLPPNGLVTIPGPDPTRLPTWTSGVHHLLLRIEATSDKEGDSNLAAAGAGSGTVPAGGVAGFPLPTLRYIVGTGAGTEVTEETEDRSDGLRLVRPAAGAALTSASSPGFAWVELARTAVYRVEFSLPSGERRFTALVSGQSAVYRAPPLLASKVGGGAFRWRVVAVNRAGHEMARSRWRPATFTTTGQHRAP
jgi:hypothetical protein